MGLGALLAGGAWATEAPIRPKVALISMFAPQAQHWIERLELNPKLQAKAFALSQRVTLSESQESAAWRLKYPKAPANQPPVVTRCDTLAGNTWFSGTRLSERAEVWTRLLTDNKGTYCPPSRKTTPPTKTGRPGKQASPKPGPCQPATRRRRRADEGALRAMTVGARVGQSK